MAQPIPLYTEEQYEDAATRDKLPLRCPCCGREYGLEKRIIREIRLGKRKRDHCSVQCAARERRVPDMRCAECGNPVHRCTSWAKKVKHVFCSASCNAKYHNRLRWGEKPKDEKIVVRHRLTDSDKTKMRKMFEDGATNIEVCEAIEISRFTSIRYRKKWGFPPSAREPVVPTRFVRMPKAKRRCKRCGKETHNEIYCSGTCRNLDLNPHRKGQRSKAEELLVQSLRSAYPAWTILTNNRTILNGLELDVYIQEINLAIEWNGVFHYEPIRGKDGLERVMTKDNLKIDRCKELGIELIVVCDRTSHKRFIKETVDSLVDRLCPLYKFPSGAGIEPAALAFGVPAATEEHGRI